MTRSSPSMAASAAFSLGRNKHRLPASRTAIAMDNAPRTGRNSPLRLISPINTLSSGNGSVSVPNADSSPRRIGRSYTAPSFLISAGARLTVFRQGGICMPMLRAAVITRSRDSFTAAPGRPTRSKEGNPLLSPHSTVTRYPSIP